MHAYKERELVTESVTHSKTMTRLVCVGYIMCRLRCNRLVDFNTLTFKLWSART